MDRWDVEANQLPVTTEGIWFGNFNIRLPHSSVKALLLFYTNRAL